jgi:hypothetical protein
LTDRFVLPVIRAGLMGMAPQHTLEPTASQTIEEPEGQLSCIVMELVAGRK